MNSQFGEQLRSLRKKQKLYLRQVAPLLEMDTAQLSKIENGLRQLKREQIPIIAEILKANSDELMTLWLTDQIYAVVKDEKLAIEAMQVAEKNINQKRKKNKQMAHKTKYSFSFTGASALIPETLIIAEEYTRLKDWVAVEKSLLEHNLLNKVKQATFKREFSEIKKRLSLLTEEQLQVMTDGNLDDAKAMILISLVKAYAFVKDFIVEAIRNKYLLFDPVLREIDYIKFLNSKCLVHTEINMLSETSAKKVKQRIFTLLEQIGIISQVKNGIILKPVLSSRVLNVILEDDPVILTVFLYSNEEIKSLLQKLKHV